MVASLEAFSLTRPPAIFGGGEIGSETVKKKKAFSDEADSEASLKERLSVFNGAKMPCPSFINSLQQFLTATRP